VLARLRTREIRGSDLQRRVSPRVSSARISHGTRACQRTPARCGAAVPKRCRRRARVKLLHLMPCSPCSNDTSRPMACLTRARTRAAAKAALRSGHMPVPSNTQTGDAGFCGHTAYRALRHIPVPWPLRTSRARHTRSARTLSASHLARFKRICLCWHRDLVQPGARGVGAKRRQVIARAIVAREAPTRGCGLERPPHAPTDPGIAHHI
jgi:hypothetical protein